MNDPESEAKFNHRTIMWACIAVGVCGIVYFAVHAYLVARDAAIRSYVSSVCQAVEDYRLRYGRYPVSLEQIDGSVTDYDAGIPLTALEYAVGKLEFEVAYSGEWRQTISVSRKLIED